jgi:hypothetical protein
MTIGIVMQPQALKVIGLGVGATALFLCSVFAYIAYLKRVAPALSVEDADIYSKDGDRRFKKLDGRSNGVFLLLTICFGVAVFFLLRVVGQLRFAMLPPALMSFPISGAFFGLIAGFTGMGLAMAAFGPVSRYLWPEDTRWYSLYLSNRRYDCDYDRLCRGFGVGTILLALITLVLGLNCYVQVRNEALVVHHFFGLHEQVYPFTEIKSIETAPKFVAPNGRIRHDRDYIVDFKDGQKWIAGDLPSGDIYERGEVANLLSKKSGVAIKEIPIFYTSDLYD